MENLTDVEVHTKALGYAINLVQFSMYELSIVLLNKSKVSKFINYLEKFIFKFIFVKAGTRMKN